MNWINVKDKLPELEQSVLITDGKLISMAYRWEGSRKPIYWASAGCSSHEGCDLDVNDDAVTHWMPLPELPK